MARARGGGGAGYAAALVIFGAGFVICLLLAIIFYTQLGGARQSAQQSEQELNNVASAQERGTQQFQSLSSGNGTVLGNLLDQNEKLTAQLNTAQNKLQQTQSQLEAKQAQLEQAQNARQQAQSAAQTAEQQKNQLAQQFNDKAQQLQNQLNQTQTVYTSFQDNWGQAQNQIQGQMSQRQQQSQEQVNQLQSQLADARNQVQTLQRQLDQIRSEFGSADNPTRNLTQPDAQIVSKLGNNQVSLNIGSNQHVLLGMTFEIFGPDQNIQLNEFDELRGKATVEVYSLQPNSAIARIVRRSPGSNSIREGDQAVNLAYSPDTTYRFYVYGKFNIDGENDPTDADRQRVENMISRWNGVLADQLSYNVDFLVLGVEPPAPEALPENVVDPTVIQQNVQARRNYETYQNLIAQANQLGIPVLNQNRFLALMGYYQR